MQCVGLVGSLKATIDVVWKKLNILFITMSTVASGFQPSLTIIQIGLWMWFQICRQVHCVVIPGGSWGFCYNGIWVWRVEARRQGFNVSVL